MNSFNYKLDQLDYFRQVATPGVWPEGSLQKWTKDVNLSGLSYLAQHDQIGRAELKAMAGDHTCPDRDVLWSILGWGKMRRDHARTLAKNEGKWCDVVNRLRSGDLSRADGYAFCHATMTGVARPGIGPAYFTKLIFFADPKHDGYIMDQWTARSSNLLIDGPRIVRMQSRAYVSPKNDHATYEKYCQLVEDLARKINRSPEETEQCLFSKGGKKPDPWRKHILMAGG